MDEFLLGGIAASGAGFFTNPLEVAKTRMQLQGEMKARGQYRVHYKNVFHAFYTIGKVDGVCALQKGLVPALWYQFFMNGFRLGAYQVFSNLGWNKDKDGKVSFVRSVFMGAASGCVGAACGSPFYMVKTQLQAQANQAIAVGYQRELPGMFGALRVAFHEHGVRGLWRGVSGAVPRVMVGSGAQLSTFSTALEIIISLKIFREGSLWNTLSASMCSGVVVVMFMTPFDVVSTRLYNQATDTHGKGIYYKGLSDCFLKIFHNEGLWGFYKGWGASLFRLGPHTVLSLVFWQETRRWYAVMKQKVNEPEI
ncbi:hypothetical protein CAPTEDRAFT_174650 [Capitella teleta]|uniref:Solute carrier family 25 member 35 n=1 Tax=Capitella teleta TaxID=283909 RepID=R7TQN1_CAPTE|nr:hypothetical protein CAPTEDRAFT_174650 [Capitella teleta]|eukprot:ELT95862.1 hypothetical protein CAPTEDRAFT_174650 [Capitella teleta]